MAQPNPHPSNNIQYDPLPLTQDQDFGNQLYNAPPSPGPGTPNFSTPRIGQHDLPSDMALPAGAGASQPRFLGAALYSEGGPQSRDSFASSQHSLHGGDRGSEYNGSVYALNDSVGSRTLTGSPYRDDPHDGYYGDNDQGHAMSPMGRSTAPKYLGEKQAMYAAPKSKRKVMILAVLASLILLILAVVIPLYFAVIRPRSNAAAGAPGSSDPAKDQDDPKSTAKPVSALVSGGDGSMVTLDDGTQFKYVNSFGGRWYYDENDPFNNGAKAQEWTPALNETFKYGIDRIHGVNLGGWLNTEPFISPALYEKYASATPPAIDEWTLSQAMRADTAGGGIGQMEEHYKTFITEKDFIEIAAAGLNYVRIPIAYWAVEVKPGEPFLEKVSWTYFLKAIKWARKYGIRINLDLHAIPGSQNGWNHSGRLGTVGFLNGPMGLANAQRALDTIRVIAEFISQDQYKDVVTMFGILNEPQGTTMGQDALSRLYVVFFACSNLKLISLPATLKLTTLFALQAVLVKARVPMSRITMDSSAANHGRTSLAKLIVSHLTLIRTSVSVASRTHPCLHMRIRLAASGAAASTPPWAVSDSPVLVNLAMP
ncbi:hypothetical protein HGRIS_013547 [Hohenbuehelia grisea]|uniref:glucan 1,3-beta-glucosidase n=1 Tax=Hohenbuehelia grisea TaxID=104357 RepID=A0ABR3IVX4_9AGAR